MYGLIVSVFYWGGREMKPKTQERCSSVVKRRWREAWNTLASTDSILGASRCHSQVERERREMEKTRREERDRKEGGKKRAGKRGKLIFELEMGSSWAESPVDRHASSVSSVNQSVSPSLSDTQTHSAVCVCCVVASKGRTFGRPHFVCLCFLLCVCVCCHGVVC